MCLPVRARTCVGERVHACLYPVEDIDMCKRVHERAHARRREGVCRRVCIIDAEKGYSLCGRVGGMGKGDGGVPFLQRDFKPFF